MSIYISIQKTKWWNTHIHSASAHKLCKLCVHQAGVACFVSPPTLLLELNCCLRLVGLSFLLPHYSIFSLHSTVDCQFFSRVVYVFEASAKLIQSRGGALWLELSLQDSPQPVGLLSHCVIKLSRNCSQWLRACAQTKHTALNALAGRSAQSLSSWKHTNEGSYVSHSNVLGCQIFPVATGGTVEKNPIGLEKHFFQQYNFSDCFDWLRHVSDHSDWPSRSD